MPGESKMDSAKKVMEVRHLKKYFFLKGKEFFRPPKTVYAVDDVSLFIHKGETLGLVGESGSGKTTVGRCLLRLIEPTAGEISFEGNNIADAPPEKMRVLRRWMQIVFQDPYGSLTSRMKILDLLTEPLAIHGIGTKSDRKDRVASIMSKVGLKPEHMQRFPHEFSGGQRQRISIARAIILEPKLVIADEPVSALDVSVRAQVLNLMANLQSELGLAYLLISHDLSVVKYMSDRIAVMYLGKIVEVAPRDELYFNHQHPYTEALLSAIPLPKVRATRERIILEGDVPSPLKPPPGCKFHPRCPRRMDRCGQVEPDFKELKAGHFVACHLI
jgi:oligopeptide/dipeptide ABC transporter ATP-binding protein